MPAPAMRDPGGNMCVCVWGGGSEGELGARERVSVHSKSLLGEGPPAVPSDSA